LDNQLSSRVQRIKPSPTLAVTQKAAELKAQGKDIIGLGAGEPDFDTPEYIKEAAIQAILAGKTKYTAVDGTPSLKDAIIAKFKRFNHLSYEPQQIIVSNGGKQGLINLFLAVLEQDDEVIIPAPYWVSYPDMALLADAKPVIIETTIAQRFKITPAQLEAAITPRSKLFVLNSPSNPSGISYSEQELAALGEVLLRYPEICIVTDDIYEHVIWDKQPFYNILMVCPELYSRTIVCTGVSKAYAMTGWRIGYSAGPVQYIQAMKKIQSQTTSNPCSISQAAAEAALLGEQSAIATMVSAFKARHDFVVQRLNALPGVECLAGDGTFYAFPCVQGLIEQMPNINSDSELATYLLEHAQVAVVPGIAFGAPGHLRLSFATSMQNLEKALDRIALSLKS